MKYVVLPFAYAGQIAGAYHRFFVNPTQCDGVPTSFANTGLTGSVMQDQPMTCHPVDMS